MSESSRQRLGVLLVNLGTPDAPTPAAVRSYLREFLSDSRVIEIPRPLWQIILRLFILPFRPQRVAKLYELIWEQGDSPMRRILREQSVALATQLQQTMPAADIKVLPAMSYGQPSLRSALDGLQEEGVEKLLVLPLFPQYSATSTAPVYDIVARWALQQRNLPTLTVIKDYFSHPAYIAALAASVREHQQVHGRAQKLLMSFHGIPQPYADKGDPYPERCHETARLLAEALGLAADEWAYSFQSRFGFQPWVQPYTDVLLTQWAETGVESVQVLCPAFSADCLETLEEIAGQNRETFLHAGGKKYEYIPALNARADHITMMQSLLTPYLGAELSS